MPVFRYNAVDQAGGVVRGKMTARNLADLEARIGRLGLTLINFRSSGTGALGSLISTLGQRKVTADDLAQFCFYVEQLVSGGVPLLEGLADVRDSVSNPALRQTVTVIIQDIEQGATLSQAMRNHPRVFDSVFCSLVEAGEFSGGLDKVLANLGDNIKWQDEVIKKTKKAMTYPIFAIIIIACVGAAMLLLVVPQLITLLRSLGQDLPGATIALIATSEFLQEYWLLIATVVAGAVVLLQLTVRLVPGADYAWDTVKLRLPLIGGVIEKLLLSRFANIFGMLYASGVSVIDALKISRGALGNKYVARGLDRVITQIVEGKSLADAFRESGLFPPLVLRMLKLGETTGGVDKAMLQIKTYYDRDAGEAIETMQAAIGPIMLFIGAGLIIWLIVAVLAPVYDAVSNIQ